MMDVENKLGKLQKIQKVDAPPFLYAKIKNKIDSQYQKAPASFKWSFALVTMILIALNFSVLSKLLKQQEVTATENVVNAMSLSSSNNFYDEQN